MTSPALAEDRPDPLKQASQWLWDFVRASGLKWPEPPPGLVMKLCRVMFDCGKTLEDLELLLQQLFAKHSKPKDGYQWFLAVAKSEWETFSGTPATPGS